MGRSLFSTSTIAAGLILVACSPSEDSAPTFQVTSPTLATTSTTAPETLEYVGVPELSAVENDMCRFVQNVGSDLESSDDRSVANTQNAQAAAKDRTLSEPLKLRLLRDAELANARRFANVLSQFSAAAPIIAKIDPGPLTDQATLDQDARDAALISQIGADIQNTIDSLVPPGAAERAELAAAGNEWTDIFTQSEFDLAIRTLNNPKAGMGLEGEAREAMERLDDWSWRHCSAGLTR